MSTLFPFNGFGPDFDIWDILVNTNLYFFRQMEIPYLDYFVN